MEAAEAKRPRVAPPEVPAGAPGLPVTAPPPPLPEASKSPEVAAPPPTYDTARGAPKRAMAGWQVGCRANGQNATLGPKYVDKHAVKAFVRERAPRVLMAVEFAYVWRRSSNVSAAAFRAVRRAEALGDSGLIFKATHLSGGVMMVTWDQETTGSRASRLRAFDRASRQAAAEK